MNLNSLREAALEISKIGGNHTLNYFQKGVEVISKADDSPVTIADRETEELMREEILKRFPDHGIIGEEHGKTNESSSIQWVLDPIDGTKSFIHGVPFYTNLIGIMIDNEPVVGVINAPALNEVCIAAKGLGAEFNGKACTVKQTTDLKDSTFLVTEINRFNEMGIQSMFQEFLDKTKVHRTWGDAYGHMMVAIGRAELMIDPQLSIWDAAALLPVVVESGGTFMDFKGKETIHTGEGFSCNKSLAPKVLEVMEKYSKN